LAREVDHPVHAHGLGAGKDPENEGGSARALEDRDVSFAPDIGHRPEVVLELVTATVR